MMIQDLSAEISWNRIWVRYSSAYLAVVLLTGQVSASHSTLDCSPPESLMPLMNLLHSLGELAFLAGVSIGTLGFISAGICLMIPGEDWTRRGKQIVKTVFIGVVLLLSADMIVAYLISQMGGTIC